MEGWNRENTSLRGMLWSSEQGGEGKQIFKLLLTSAMTTHSHKSQNSSCYLCIALSTSGKYGKLLFGFPEGGALHGTMWACAGPRQSLCCGCPVGLCRSAGREACSLPCSTRPMDLHWGSCVQMATCFLWFLFISCFSMQCVTMKNPFLVNFVWWYAPFLPRIFIRGRQHAWLFWNV